MSRRQRKITIAVRVALGAMVATMGLTLAAGTAGAAVGGVTYAPTNCGYGTQVQNCPTSTSLMSASPSTFQFGTINSNGGNGTASVTFTNTSGQSEQFAISGGFSASSGDTMTPTGCGFPNNDSIGYTTLSAGQACTIAVTLHITDGGSGVISPAIASAENYFAMRDYVNAQGSSSGSAFYIPFYATLTPGGGGCPPGYTGNSPDCIPPVSAGCAHLPPSTAGMAATADDGGYWIVNSSGTVDNCGDAAYYGYWVGAPSPVVGIVATPDSHGYWMVTTTGAVQGNGDAGNYGSMAGVPLNKPVVAMAATPSGHGYWLVATDGGLFAFGDAAFHGSMGGYPLNKPINGITDDPATGGYWMVASDGGIFAFDAPFHGSMGGSPLNKPVVGMAVDRATNGYWLVASDGGIFSFGAPFFGSTGAIVLNQPIVGMEAAPSGAGYRFVAADGGIFDFGSSGFHGSAA